jgi:O-antigen/teichoic acid export membrane protein
VAGSLGAGLAIQCCLIASGIAVARMLGVQHRGQFALMTLFPAVLTQLGGLGVPTAVTYFVARRPDSVRAVARSVFPYFLAQTILLTLLDGLIVARVFAGDSSTIQAAAWITLVSVPAIMSQQLGLSILQGLEQFRDFNFLRVAPVALYSVGAVVALLGGSTSIVFVVIAWSGSWLLVAIATQIRARRVLSPRTGREAEGSVGAGVVYRFGLKALLGWVSPVEVLRLDQAVVGLFLSTASLGLYVVALSFTNLTRFVAQSVGMVGYPHIAAEKDAARAWHSMWRFVGLAAVVCTALVLVLELTVGWLLPLFFGAEFSDAVSLARLLIIATLLTSVRRVLGDSVRGVGHPSLGSIAEVLSWIVLLPCLALLTSAHGTTGVAVSLILAGLTSLAILTALVLRVSMRPVSGDRSAGIERTGDDMAAETDG